MRVATRLNLNTNISELRGGWTAVCKASWLTNV